MAAFARVAPVITSAARLARHSAVAAATVGAEAVVVAPVGTVHVLERTPEV